MIENGAQFYMTTRLVFPRDKDEWIRQEPIPSRTPMGVMHFIEMLKLTDDQKKALCNSLECSWKNPDGVWVQIKIERTVRNKKWGNVHTARKTLRTF